MMTKTTTASLVDGGSEGGGAICTMKNPPRSLAVSGEPAGVLPVRDRAHTLALTPVAEVSGIDARNRVAIMPPIVNSPSVIHVRILLTIDTLGQIASTQVQVWATCVASRGVRRVTANMRRTAKCRRTTDETS